MNFHSAAFTYLYEWVYFDRHYMKVLTFTTASEPEPARACEQLVEVAKHYGIIRNFKHEDGTATLLPAWNALKGINQPTSGEDAKECVDQLVAALRPAYGHDLWSAASKFLWMRFGTPVVIFDSITWSWMCKNADCPKSGGYGGFYDAWQAKFDAHKSEIRVICEELKELSVARKFFDRDDEIGQRGFDEAVSSLWFAERVFDHAMLSDV